MSIEYRGKTFPGYNKPVKSDKKGKKKNGVSEGRRRN